MKATVSLLAALLGALGTQLPGVAAGVTTEAAPPRSSADSPNTVANTGGVLSLYSPASEMVLLRAGTFTMGSTEGAVVEAFTECLREPLGHRCDESTFGDELPQRKIVLSDVWFDRTEVTVEAYARCVALRRCRPPPYYGGARRFRRARLPVSLVTWEDARRYCAFRSARLPTEAEFERAARGKTGRQYPWGNLYNSHAANHGRLSWDDTDATDGFPELAPVGSFPSGATPEGILDLAGNAREWISDRYAPRYDAADLNDPRGPGPATGSGRVIRGGGYRSAAPWLRGAAREGADPTLRRPDVGFRCARGV